jgi:Uma2 family endonuclease
VHAENAILVEANKNVEANMATASTDPTAPATIYPVARRLTAADLAAMPKELPSGPIDFELDNGRLVQMSPTGWRHGILQSRIARALTEQGEDRDHGRVATETGVILSTSPDRVVGPDALFICKSSLPVRLSPENYLKTIPELVVEIRSKNDSAAYLEAKVANYLQAGVRVVWVVDGQANTVTEHRAATLPRTSSTIDTLTCDEIIPGFQLNLGDLFKE